MNFEKYPKINSVFKRDEKNQFIEGNWSREEFDLLQNVKWSASEKIDGTNIRIGWDPFEGIVQFGARTDRSQIPAPLINRLKEIFTDEKMNNTFPATENEDGTPASPGVIFYGEGYGNKIQKVGKLYNPNGVDFILFDVKIGKWWLKREDVENIAADLGIKAVPFVENMTLNEAISRCKEGFKSSFGDFSAEGYVMKLDLLDRSGNRMMTKVKLKDFQ